MAAKLGHDWFLILGHPVAKRSIWVSVLVFVLCVFGAAGLYYFALQSEQQVIEAKELRVVAASLPKEILVEPKTTLVVLKEVQIEAFKDPLKALLARHLAVTGFDQMKRVSVSGEYRVGGSIFDLSVMARAPESYKQVFKLQDIKAEIGCVGGELWLEQSRQVFDIEEGNLKKVNRVFMFMELAIPLIGWQDPYEIVKADYDLLPDQDWQGRPVSVIRSDVFEVPILHFIDLSTQLEVRRTATVLSENGVEHLLEVLFDAPQEGLRFPLPSGYTCRMDGELVSTAKFTQYEFDVWLPSILFEKRWQ
jgi:hypothetical protein